MSREVQRLDEYLRHILDAIERIERYASDMDLATFLVNSLVQDAVLRNLEIIGEASNNLIKNCPKFVTDHPELPLNFAYEMRNAIAHGYFKVDFEIVWRTIRVDLPDFREHVGSILH